VDARATAAIVVAAAAATAADHAETLSSTHL